ncbi:MAG: dihydroorotate dehydrogenase electron transfer subunit [Oscillospiraceae bacterium]|nr:dihydroorotate dehydrogenase electron transfer subunit [Oscillospiraceae bacterium]
MFVIKVGKYRVIEKSEIAPGIFSFWLECPEAASCAQPVEPIKPGQFAHIAVPGNFMLRRPISICEAKKGDNHNALQGSIRIVFEIKGDGTHALSETAPGDYLDIIAPLGKGFKIDTKYKNPCVIGGGIGVPPLLELTKHLKNPVAILGFSNKRSVILRDEFTKSADVYITTDEKSEFFYGNVTDKLKHLSESHPVPDIIYACGPVPMLNAIINFAKKNNIPAQLSLEQRMACGVGACLVCACKAKTVKNGEYYAHVCKDGPVFDIEELPGFLSV